MSEVLNFSCPVDNCGRKFATKEKLDNHIKLRHPSASKNNNKIKSNIPKNKNETKISDNKQINKNVINNKASINKKDELEPKTIKKEEKIFEKIEKKDKNEISINKNKDQSKIINTEAKKEKLEKEKNKIILDDLYSKINSLENYFENENLELQKQFEIAEIPNMDNILIENEKDEQEKDNNIEENDINNDNNDLKINNDNIDNNLKVEKKEKEEEINLNKKESENKKGEIIKENNQNIEQKYDLTDKQKNYDKDKVITITEELILQNSDSQNEELDSITSLNLSKKNIASFMTNRDVNFTEIPNLKKLNLSYNWMTFTYDLRLFKNLEELYINDNKIDDISFCEFLPQLKILNCENNEITYITSLKKCQNLKILKLSQNKIQYMNSTLGVFKSLNLLEELTIKENPFLSEIFAYKQYFLSQYQNLLKFENEEINDIDRDIAGRFVRQNNSMYKNTPLYNLNNEDDDIKNSENDGNLKDTFRVGNTIITKTMVVPYKGKEKYINNNLINEGKNLKTKDKKEIKEENNKNKELKEIIKSQKKEIDDLKLELENINQLNKDYEVIIEDCKTKIENNKLKQNKPKEKNNKEEEKNKLLKELEMWKKEYIDLFNKINKNSLFPSLLTKDKIQNPKSHFLQKEIKIEQEDISTKEIKENRNTNKIQRPQTAQVKKTNPANFDDLCQGLKIMYSKNQFLDVLEEESDEEEEQEKKENIEDDKNIKEEIDYDGNDIIPDDEIDELFRKSCADLQKMKDEIKFMNENIDKSGNNYSNSNIIYNKGGKMKLNPVIVKKENNPNFIGNKNIFGNLNQKKI